MLPCGAAGQFFVFFDWVHDTLTVPGSRRAGNGKAPEPGSDGEAMKATKAKAS